MTISNVYDYIEDDDHCDLSSKSNVWRPRRRRGWMHKLLLALIGGDDDGGDDDDGVDDMVMMVVMIIIFPNDHCNDKSKTIEPRYILSYILLKIFSILRFV